MAAKYTTRIRFILYGIMLLGMIAAAFGSSGATSARTLAGAKLPPPSGDVSLAGPARSQSGWFSIIWGDALQGAARTLYTLTDERGQATMLHLDETLAQSLGGVLSFNHRYVRACRGPGELALPARAHRRF
jgi:hypothetical protein